MIEEWTPEPLVEAPSETEWNYINKIPVISGYVSLEQMEAIRFKWEGDVNYSPTGPKTRLSNGKTVINLASYNFLNFGNLDRLRNKAVDILHDYGVGACGPPGFYGTLGPLPPPYPSAPKVVLTIDVHAQVEVDIAKFLGVEAAIIYAQAFSTVSSVIPDFSKRGDIIVAYFLSLFLFSPSPRMPLCHLPTF